jgi:CheY-like chemotaxis protein
VTLPPHVFANDRPRRRTIVLVEDEPEATCCILESAGFEVLPADDAQDAMKVYEECKRGIDLAMTDMVLPGWSGERLGQDLREQSPEVVVLVTSGCSNLEYETEKPGSRTYFLAKPGFEADAGREDGNDSWGGVAGAGGVASGLVTQLAIHSIRIKT